MLRIIRPYHIADRKPTESINLRVINANIPISKCRLLIRAYIESNGDHRWAASNSRCSLEHESEERSIATNN